MTSSSLSRRAFCRQVISGVAGVTAAPALLRAGPPAVTATCFDLRRPPDLVRVLAGGDPFALSPAGELAWETRGAALRLEATDSGHRLFVRGRSLALQHLQLRWSGPVAPGLRVLGDAWERAYGDLQWRPVLPHRALPWYCLTHDGRVTHGYGVKVRPHAFCFWTIDDSGLSLWIDIRNGTRGVELGERELAACETVSRTGSADESPFAAARAFCRSLCADPLLPSQPLLGVNDWYYSYGASRPEEILQVTDRIGRLRPTAPHRYFSIIDGGWAPGGSEFGPWERAQSPFGEMENYTARLRAAGAEAGLWFRPLAANPVETRWLLPSRTLKIYDPSLPEVCAQVAADIRRFRGWGFSLIKHDFSTWDFFLNRGPAPVAIPAAEQWNLADRSRTNAEVLLEFYRAMRLAADDALLLGCNAISHLAAGVFELNRIGDDVSGRSWDRTRRVGVNALAFRLPQHHAFYAADPDLAVFTPAIPAELSGRWLDLIAASGMPLLVSPDLAAVSAAQMRDLKEAFALSVTAPAVEPLDWLDRASPQDWKTDSGRVLHFDWTPREGAWPFRD